jgi:hypothetical protein
MPIAIACAAGSFRGAFVHGVLSAFEENGLRADAYAAASSSILPAALAALGRGQQLGGAEYWKLGLEYLQVGERGMSELNLAAIAQYSALLRNGLFKSDVSRFVIAASAVITAEAATQTQGDGARRLGRRLLLATRRRDSSWADQHLALHLFGTLDSAAMLPLTPQNLADVIYASTRMLHAWRIPAAVDGHPYIDASYTCSCPALEMAELGYEQVIAIVPEPGTVYRDLFQSEPIPPSWGDVPIHLIQPAWSLGEVGVDYATATQEGLDAAFRHGEKAGEKFLEEQKPGAG